MTANLESGSQLVRTREKNMRARMMRIVRQVFRIVLSTERREEDRRSSHNSFAVERVYKERMW